MSRFDSELYCLLNANGIDIEHVSGGYRSASTIDREAILLAMYGSSQAEMALALYTAGEQAEYHNLLNGLISKSEEDKEFEKFKEKHEHEHELLCRLAIFEFTNRPHCSACSGSGHKEDHTTCPACNGVGIKPISNTKRSSIFGKSHKSWAQFAPMFAILLGLLDTWRDRNERKLNKKLK